MEEENKIACGSLLLGIGGAEVVSKGIFQSKPVYINSGRVHHWQVGGLSMIRGLALQSSEDRKTRYAGIFLAFLGLGIFLHDLDDFLRTIEC